MLYFCRCLFGELLLREAILPGSSELKQLELIYTLCGSPSGDTLELYSTYPNWDKMQFEQQFPNTMNRRFANIDTRALDLIQRILHMNPEKRFNAEDALDHEYFHHRQRIAPENLPRFKVTSGAHEFEVRQKNEELKAERQRAKAAAMEKQAAAGRGTATSGIRLNNSRLFSRGGRVGAGGRGVSKFIVHGKVDPKLVAAKGVSAPSGSEQVTEDISAADDGKEELPDADGEGQ